MVLHALALQAAERVRKRECISYAVFFRGGGVSRPEFLLVEH